MTETPIGEGDLELRVAEQTFKVIGRPRTLVCPSAEMDLGPPIEYPGRIAISSPTTLYHAERVKTLHPETSEAWAVFHASVKSATKVDLPLLSQSLAADVRRMGTGAHHVLGLIDISLKLMDQKVPVTWLKPENHLHPSWQCALADLALWFVRRLNEGGCSNIPTETQNKTSVPDPNEPIP